MEFQTMGDQARPQDPVPAPAGGRPDRAEQVRAAALDLFAARGYQLTTMDEIGERAGIRGPSVYKHVRSKQDLLAGIMLRTMTALLENQQAALDSSDDIETRLRRVAEAHVRYHARHAAEAFVGNREINSLEEPHRADILDRRGTYERRLRQLIADGVDLGRFRVPSTRLASYAILDMGIGVAMWFRPHGELAEDEIVHQYGEMALRIAGSNHQSGSHI
ncbi:MULTISPECIES: TetR/AcrR family transcriptional regulator [unclassified Micromonospora]|uniref:TetR/AcrR family transcriptional regulator n=1 Tax=unclassified Micromonospora TaxID=2617518 RepID=UPI00363714D6